MHIRQLDHPSVGELAELRALLRDSVEQGASVGFMLPLTDKELDGYWQGVVGELGDGAKVLLVAGEGEGDNIVGSVQLSLCTKANGAHRAEIQKLLVHSQSRRRGYGRALMVDAELRAKDLKRSLLVLDTEEGSVAEGMDEHIGYAWMGTIPRFAASPHDTAGTPLRGSTFFYREL